MSQLCHIEPIKYMNISSKLNGVNPHFGGKYNDMPYKQGWIFTIFGTSQWVRELTCPNFVGGNMKHKTRGRVFKEFLKT